MFLLNKPIPSASITYMLRKMLVISLGMVHPWELRYLKDLSSETLEQEMLPSSELVMVQLPHQPACRT